MRIRLLSPVAAAFLAAALVAQSGRDSYRQAFDTWMQAQANVERDAATEGSSLLPRIDRAAAAAASFHNARAAYAKSASESAAQRRKALQKSSASISSDVAPAALGELITAELQLDNRTITRFAEDKDRGIQQLRQALERERDALAALNSSIQAREKIAAAGAIASNTLEQARMKTADALNDQTSRAGQATPSLEKEAAAWSDYYEKLTRAVQAANTPPPAPPAPASTAASPAPPPRSTALPPVPLARYIGGWAYPTTNGIFHGLQPEFVDLVVHEEGGHVDGTLYARFKLPPGNTADPVIRFDFQGDLAATFNQRFPMTASDGTQGTLELIPGPAFNLLEVNFQTVPKANKIATGNFILVKK